MSCGRLSIDWSSCTFPRSGDYAMVPESMGVDIWNGKAPGDVRDHGKHRIQITQLSVRQSLNLKYGSHCRLQNNPWIARAGLGERYISNQMALRSGSGWFWSLEHGIHNGIVPSRYVYTYIAVRSSQPAILPWGPHRQTFITVFSSQVPGPWALNASNTSVVKSDSLTLPIMASSNKSPLRSAPNQKPNKDPSNLVSS